MPGRKPPEGKQTEQIVAAVRELTEQIEVLRNAIDELRSGFVWAVRNERLGGSDRSEDSSPSLQVTVAPPLELDEEQFEAIAEIVQENLREVSDDLAEVVRGQLRQELSDFRDSLDQISTDITWAVRTVRQPLSYQSPICCERPDDSEQTTTAQESQAQEPAHDLHWSPGKTINGSAAVAHATQPSPSPPREAKQRSLFDS